MVTKNGFPLWGIFSIAGIGIALGLLFLILLFVPVHRGSYGFDSLQTAVSYADRMLEYPEMDNTNLVRPDYTTFHTKQLIGTFQGKLQTIFSWVGLQKKQLWTPEYFAESIARATKLLKLRGVKKNIIYKIATKPDTGLIIWGDLQGAYHSFVRGLQKLHEMKILGNDFKILKKDTFFVFMGDAISRSAYGMEILSLMLRLFEVNPKRVIYLRGNHEDKKYWQAFGLKDQLRIRAGHLSDTFFVPELDELFSYLPLGLYLPIPGSKNEFVRISHLGRERSKKLKEEKYVKFLQEQPQAFLTWHQIKKNVIHGSDVTIASIIHSEKKRHSFQIMDGLRQLPSEERATAWTLFSSPTTASQKGLKFFHDAFVFLRAGNEKAQWHLTLYAQDVRKKDGFKTKTYQFFTGKEGRAEDFEKSMDKLPVATVEKKNTSTLPLVEQTVSEEYKPQFVSVPRKYQRAVPIKQDVYRIPVVPVVAQPPYSSVRVVPLRQVSGQSIK